MKMNHAPLHLMSRIVQNGNQTISLLKSTNSTLFQRFLASSSKLNSSVDLVVTPQEALLDNPPHIKVKGLNRGQKVTLWNSFIDDSGFEFSSHANYISNSKGEIDLKKHTSVGGKYKGIFQEGLLATLHTAPPTYAKKKSLKWARLYKKDVTTPMKYSLRLLDGHFTEPEIYSSNPPSVLAENNIIRHLMIDGVHREEISEGNVRGILFTPPGEGPFPMILDLFGAESGSKEFRSAMLASYGYASLVLPYYNYKDLPILTDYLNMEYFIEGIDFLSSHPKANPGRVGLIGSSKGGEIGLMLSTLSDKLKALISINSYNCSINVKFMHKDKTCLEKFIADPVSSHFEVTEHGEFNAVARDWFYMWDNKFNIPIDKSYDDCHIILASGDSDGGQGYRSAIALKDRTQRFGKQNVSALVYPGAGHLLDPPFHSHTNSVWNSTIYVNKKVGDDSKHRGMPHKYGGNPYGMTQGAKDLWARTLALFHRRLVQDAGLNLETVKLYPPYTS